MLLICLNSLLNFSIIGDIKFSGIVKIITPDELYNISNDRSVIIDVRSPSEFTAGHFPGAINLPLFDDQERIQVGILYKKSGKQAAVELGLEFAGAKLAQYFERAKALSKGRHVIIYCFRGGMRSQSMAWLLDFCGMDISIVKGGYKGIRRWARSEYETRNYKLILIGGKTGSGKTKLLQILQKKGNQILDLENLASHKGSAFGWIGEQKQVSAEQFENLVFKSIFALNTEREIFVENESRLIGSVAIPVELWQSMLTSPLVVMDVEFNTRLQHLVDVYCNSHESNDENLILSFKKIGRRIGSEKMNLAINSINQKRYKDAAEIALDYYDKCYVYDFSKVATRSIHHYAIKDLEFEKWIDDFIDFCNQIMDGKN